MSCCSIGQGGNFARTSAGRFRITWPPSWTGWGSIGPTGWKLCAASADYSSKRRGDRARSSMPRRADHGTGSRVRRRHEQRLCRPPARRRDSQQHFHYAFTQGAWPSRALNSPPDTVSTGRTVRLLTSSDHAHATVVLDSGELGPPQGLERGKWMRWPIAPTGEFMGVWLPLASWLPDALADRSYR
jgi:hypothetical protein